MTSRDATPPALLRVDQFSVFAGTGEGRRTLVSEVDLAVGVGETVGIVGESGSGKSMLMKGILGLLPAGTSSAGEVRFDGERIDGRSERQLRPLRGRRLSLLLQDPFTMLNPLQAVGMTIAESLAPEQRRSRKSAKIEVARRLDEVGIEPDVAVKRPFQLSGGMRQRVAIAAALAADPELLVADEPTTALDVATQREILTLIGLLQRKRRMAMVLITHDLRVAFDVCDRILVMYAGSVLEAAPAGQLSDAALHPYTLSLKLAEPPVDHYVGRLNALTGSVPPADAVADRCPFADRCAWQQDECVTRRPSLLTLQSHRLSRCVRVDAIGDELRQLNRSPMAVQVRPHEAAASSLLRVDGLRKTFHTVSLVGSSSSHVALDGITFDVPEGGAVGLVGESGSGKTTVARSILGLTTPDEGRVLLGDHDISDYRRLNRAESKAVRRTVQVVFQDPYSSLNPALSIGSALREAVEMRGAARAVEKQVTEALSRVSLPASYATKYPAALSGGERQRVSIARAICMQPRLLICDEPVAALDVSVQAQVLELLRSIHRDLGMALLFITHDLAVVRQMTTRVVVLNRGVVVEAGDTDAVLDKPQHPYTRSLLDAVPGRTPRPQEQGAR